MVSISSNQVWKVRKDNNKFLYRCIVDTEFDKKYKSQTVTFLNGLSIEDSGERFTVMEKDFRHWIEMNNAVLIDNRSNSNDRFHIKECVS